MKLVGHVLDYILDHILDYMLDYVLDYMIIGFVTMVLQLLSSLLWAPINK